LRLEWIPCSHITDIKPTQIDNVHYAIYKRTLDEGGVEETPITLVLLGNDETCTPTVVSEFARIYSLPTHRYNNEVNRFRRYSTWLNCRGYLIKGFTMSNDNYYMVAGRRFYHYYSRYGFCGHQESSKGWTSNKKQLDEFIKKSQSTTNKLTKSGLFGMDSIRLH